MEEKEREQLKERLLKMVVNEPRLESMPPMTMAEVMVNSMSKPNLEPLLDFISQEIEKAREEVEEKFKEKYKKREEEMNVPYSEEDGKEFWQGYQEGYHQGLQDMVVDTHYLDEEFQTKLTTK